MAEKGKEVNHSKTRETSRRSKSICRNDGKQIAVIAVRKKGWSDVFDKLTYSSGPGDNVYVFG